MLKLQIQLARHWSTDALRERVKRILSALKQMWFNVFLFLFIYLFIYCKTRFSVIARHLMKCRVYAASMTSVCLSVCLPTCTATLVHCDNSATKMGNLHMTE